MKPITSFSCAGEVATTVSITWGLGIGLGLRLVLVLRYIQQFRVYMVSFIYIDLVDTVTETSPEHPIKSSCRRQQSLPRK